MEEDSKKLAGAGSFGAELHLEKKAMPVDEFRQAFSDFIMSWANNMVEEGALIGHVKLIAEVDIGFLKLSVVDTDLGVEAVDQLKGKFVNGGKVKLMAAVLNIDDEQVEHALDEELEKLEESVNFHRAGHECHHEH
jgi:hypothetical protein